MILKNTILLKTISLAFLAVLLINSCKKDKAKPSWDVNLLMPLVTDSITVTDVLDEKFFVENPDQSISFIFKEELFSMSIDTIVKLPDTLLSFGISLDFLPAPVAFNPGDTIISHEFYLPIDLNSGGFANMALEKAIIRQGNVVFESFNQSDSDLKVVLAIDKVYHPEAGSFYSVQKVAKNEFFQKAFDIADYHLDLRGPNSDTVNMLTYRVDLIIHPDEPGTVMVKPEDSIALNVYFKDIHLYYARGYFGHQTYPFGPETFEFDMFEDLDIKNISFEEAEIWLEIENTFGEEVNINVEGIYASNSHSGEMVQLESDLLGSNLFVDRANELEIESGDIETFTSRFDFSDSNFPEIFAIQPNEFTYKLSIETNVHEDSASLNNFFYYDQPIALAIDVKVDGGIKIDSLFRETRLEWQGNNINLSTISEGELGLVFSNAFPFDFSMNMYLEDEEMTIIDTLAYHLFIQGGLIDENQFVSAPSETRSTIIIDDELKENISLAKYVSYELIINSVSDKPIKIRSTDYLKFKVIGDFVYLIEQ
ncbi:MAG: hypothetical protein KAH25_01390 [Bacteroidales bacterium]|nr:hypothetical protein [Bacteroidales bacterium]